MIKSALAVLPTRPVLYIVPIIVVLAMSFYYWNLYTECTNNKQFRNTLNEFLYSEDRPTEFRLADFTGLAWDKVRIVTNFNPERRNIECPFGWNWSRGERESLIASNLLTVMVFAYDGLIVEYLELRSDRVAFENVNSSLSPDEAKFNIVRNQSDTTGVILNLIQ